MRRATWAGLLTLFGCLLLVGLVRAVVPEDPPLEYHVGPDRQGIARTDEVSIELVGLEAATRISSAREFSDSTFEASPGTRLVLGRFKLSAHGDAFLVRAQIRTADGFTYEALPIGGFPQPGIVHVGMRLTTTFIWEVPEDKLEGFVGIHGSRADGLQPVAPLVVFDLPDDLRHRGSDDAVVPEDVVEAVR